MTISGKDIDALEALFSDSYRQLADECETVEDCGDGSVVFLNKNGQPRMWMNKQDYLRLRAALGTTAERNDDDE